MNAPDRDLSRAEFDERYTMLSGIGAGGMGMVWRARQRSLDRVVAIKQMVPGEAATADGLKRFVTEARIQAKLIHPNVIQLYDFGTVEGQPFIVMELVEGRNLRDLLDDPAPPDVRELVEVIVEVLKALEYLHANGVLHRDLKPANVIVTPAGQVKVADLGLASNPAWSGLTRTDEVVGTPDYMAPEQAAAGPASPRSDLYAVGVLLCEAITGALPRGMSCDAKEFVHLRTTMDPAPFSVMAPGAVPALCTLVDGLLTRDPSERHATAVRVRWKIEQLLRSGQRLERAEALTHGRKTAPLPRHTALNIRPSRAGERPARGFAPLAVAAGLLGVAALALRPGNPPAAPRTQASPLAIVNFSVARGVDDVVVAFDTTRPAGAVVELRAVDAAPEQPWLEVRQEHPVATHRLAVRGLDPLRDYRVRTRAEAEGSAASPEQRLPSAWNQLARFAVQLDSRDIVHAIPEHLADGSLAPGRLAAEVELALRDAGMPEAVAAVRPSRRAALFPSAGVRSIPLARRVQVLNALEKLARLDRLMALRGVAGETGVAALLVPGHASGGAAGPAPRVISAAVPADFKLEPRGPGADEHLGLGSPIPGALEITAPPLGDFRGARLEIEATCPSPDVNVRVLFPACGLSLEMWAPKDTPPGQPVRFTHTFDPGFLVAGVNRFELSLGMLEGQQAFYQKVLNGSLPTARALRVPVLALRLELW